MSEPKSMGEYLALPEAEKMRLAALPPVRSEPLLAALIEAGDRLSPFLQHGLLCQFAVDAGKPCHCGLDAKWSAWEAAKSTANARNQGLAPRGETHE